MDEPDRRAPSPGPSGPGSPDPAGARPRPRGREEVVAAVLDAAERLLAERGPAQVSLREIAEAARVNVGLIHRHIGAKDALVRAVVDRFIARGHDVVGDIGTWDELVALVFTPTDQLYDYTHLLAWLVLEGADTAGSASPPSPLEQLATQVGDGRTGRDEVAALVALAYGWQLFTPYLARALRYRPDELEGLRGRLAELARGLPQIGPRATPGPGAPPEPTSVG